MTKGEATCLPLSLASVARSSRLRPCKLKRPLRTAQTGSAEGAGLIRGHKHRASAVPGQTRQSSQQQQQQQQQQQTGGHAGFCVDCKERGIRVSRSRLEGVKWRRRRDSVLFSQGRGRERDEGGGISSPHNCQIFDDASISRNVVRGGGGVVAYPSQCKRTSIFFCL